MKEEKRERKKRGKEKSKWGKEKKKEAIKGKKENNIDSLLLFLIKLLEFAPPPWKSHHQLCPVLNLILAYSSWKCVSI